MNASRLTSDNSVQYQVESGQYKVSSVIFMLSDQLQDSS